VLSNPAASRERIDGRDLRCVVDVAAGSRVQRTATGRLRVGQGTPRGRPRDGPCAVLRAWLAPHAADTHRACASQSGQAGLLRDQRPGQADELRRERCRRGVAAFRSRLAWPIGRSWPAGWPRGGHKRSWHAAGTVMARSAARSWHACCVLLVAWLAKQTADKRGAFRSEPGQAHRLTDQRSGQGGDLQMRRRRRGAVAPPSRRVGLLDEPCPASCSEWSACTSTPRLARPAAPAASPLEHLRNAHPFYVRLTRCWERTIRGRRCQRPVGRNAFGTPWERLVRRLVGVDANEQRQAPTQSWSSDRKAPCSGGVVAYGSTVGQTPQQRGS